MALTTCKYCGKKSDKENMTRQGINYFCDEQCLNLYKKQVADRRDLTDYIQELYGEFPKAVTRQIEDFKKQGMTYKGQELSLRYWYDTLEHELDKSNGIGIIPYCYDAAKQHFLDKQRVKRLSETFVDDNTIEISGFKDNSALRLYALRRQK